MATPRFGMSRGLVTTGRRWSGWIVVCAVAGCAGAPATRRVVSLPAPPPAVAPAVATDPSLISAAAAPVVMPAAAVESSPPATRHPPPAIHPATHPPLATQHPPAEAIDLATVLASVDAAHPAVGVARWRTQQAYAQLSAARRAWLPTIQAGTSYHRLAGNLQASNGQILDVNRSSLQAGLGAGAVGAGQTVRPGLVAEFHVADILYQPKIVERRAWARGHAAQAALHDQLLAAATAHQRLLAAQQRLALADDHAQRMAELARLTAEFARAGQGLRSDADRLQTEWRLSQAAVELGDEQVTAASARLCEAISAPPGTRLLCAEPVAAPIALVDASLPPAELLSIGLRNRPELKEAQCLVAEACERLRRERAAPLVPSVLLGMSYGGFGGGFGGVVGQFSDRTEFNALALWQVRNMGLGEAAIRREREAAVQENAFARLRLLDQVAREIVESHGLSEARARRLELTRDATAAAAASYSLNVARITSGEGLPIEALQAAQAYGAAQAAQVDAVLDYNAAQLQLYRALGWRLTPDA